MLGNTENLSSIQFLKLSLASTMKALLLLGIGVLYMAHVCKASALDSPDKEDNRGRSRSPSRKSHRRSRDRRRGYRDDSDDLFRDFAKAPRGDLRGEAERLFETFDDYLEHDSKVWADLKDEHVGVLLDHVTSKLSSKGDEVLTDDDMLAILKSRKTSEPCVLIGSSAFKTSRVTAEMLKFIDFGCYEKILRVREGKRRTSSLDRDRRESRSYDGEDDRDGRRREDKNPFGAFYRRGGRSVELPEDAVKRYVESHMQLSHLRARSSSNGETDLQSCGMLGLYSKHMTPKQIGQLGWSCFQSAIEAERRFERLLRGGGKRSKRNGRDDKKPKADRSKREDRDSRDEYEPNDDDDNNSEFSNNRSYDSQSKIPSSAYRLDDKMIRHLPGKLVRDGKEEFVTFLLDRKIAFGAFSGQLQAELFKSEDTCGRFKASDVFEEYDDSRVNRSRLSATDKEAARKMTPQCFNALKNLDRVNIRHSLREWPEKLFASVTHPIDANFMLYATGKQIEAFGTEVRKEDDEHACAQLKPEAIPGNHYQHIMPACFRSWVASQEGNIPTLGEPVSKLPVMTLAELGGEFIAALSPDDLAKFRPEHWTEFMKKEGACSSIPENAVHALFPSHANDDGANPTVGKKGGRRFIPDAQCMAKLSPTLQKAAVRTVSSAMPADALSLLDADALSAWSENPFGILNGVRNGTLLAGLGSKIGHGRTHPCQILTSKILLAHPTFAQHIHPECAAAMTDLNSIDNSELSKMPLAVISQLPLARIRLAREFTQLSGKDVEVLTLSNNFCSVLDHASFLAMPISARANFVSACVVQWKFVNKLTQADMESLPGDAFAMFDADSIQSVPSITWMSPVQFGTMGSKCPTGKIHPAAVVGADTLAALSIEQIGTLTSAHVAAIPAKSFSGLKPGQVTAIPVAALTTITAEQVSNMSDVAFGGFKAAQFARFGEVNRAVVDRNPIKAITRTKLDKLDTEAKAAAQALITANEQTVKSAASSLEPLGYFALSSLLLLVSLY